MDTRTVPRVDRLTHAGRSGVAAAALALAVGEICAALTVPRAAPVSAIGEVVIALAPGSWERFAIGLLGSADKPLLQWGIVAVLSVLAYFLGRRAALHRAWGFGGVAVLTAVGSVAALTRDGATGWSVLPSITAGTVGAVALVSLLDWPLRTSRDEGSRRRFLRTVTGVIAGSAVVGVVTRLWSQSRTAESARDKVRLPAPTDPALPLPTDHELDIPDLSPWRTPNADFYRIDTALTVPMLDPADYRLRIHGRVDNPLELTFDDLLSRPLIERDITLTCVSNEVGGDLVGNARWLGVRLSDLLDEVSPHTGADQLVGRSVDGFTAGAPTRLCRDGRDAMLAVGMNGEPLPAEHGFPVRMIVPGLYGYVSATKWLTELELTSFDDYNAYWIPRGWAVRAPIKTGSRIDTPRRSATSGRVAVAGVAWAQQRGIGAVEVRIDGGDWQEATLSEVASTDTWRQWVYYWDAEPGDHVIAVRATDSDGETQPEVRRPVTPDGATGWHEIDVHVD